jgi:F0F1-type ATP synthase assembly protein I
MEDKNSKFKKFSSPAVTLGYTIMASIFFFSFIGYQIDQRLKTQYWTLVGIFIGFIYSGYEVWKLIKREQEKEEEEKKKKN